MKIFALDKKDNDAWRKQWFTLSNRIEALKCNCQVEANPPRPSLVLVHHQACAGQNTASDFVKRVLDEEGFVLYVSGSSSGCEEHDEPREPRIHYSKRRVPTGTNLLYLASHFKRLVLALENSNDNGDKIKAAWLEWESSALAELLACLSPLALMPNSTKVQSAMTSRMQCIDEHILDMASKELLYEYRDNTNTQMADEFLAFNEILTNSGMSGEIWANWIKLYPQALADLSRRCL